MIYKNIVIGGGPIGIYIYSKLNDSLLIEATNHLGGQLTTLYPAKDIVDIPGFDHIKAKDYIRYLTKSIDLKNVRLNETVINIKKGKIIEVTTNSNKYQCKNLIICMGLGFSSPRKLRLFNEDKCKNILYKLNDYSFLKDKKVAIFGGGDSALDWAKTLSKISNNILLIHRRDEFRGNPETIKDVNNLRVYLSYIPKELIIKNNEAKQIIIQSVKDNSLVSLDIDYILVNFGNVVSLTNIGIKTNNNYFDVNNNFKIENNIYACGDCINYENKKRRIAPALEEANKILKLIS